MPFRTFLPAILISMLPGLLLAQPGEGAGHVDDDFVVEEEHDHVHDHGRGHVDWFDGHVPWRRWEKMTGDWGGHRPALEEHGVRFESYYLSDTSKVTSGGIRRKTTTRSLFDISVDVDLDRMLNIPGATFHAEVFFQTGSNGSRHVGDLQLYDNLDADNRKQLVELWVQKELHGGDVRIKVGKIDVNRDFAFLESGFMFLNTAFLYSPTMLFTLPTYPESATGGAIFLSPGRHGPEKGRTTLGVGLFDGAIAEGFRLGTKGPDTFFDDPSDLFLIGELDLRWGSDDAGGHGFFGLWRHTGDFVRFDGRTTNGTEGYYLGFEHCLWHQNGRSMTLFGRHGVSDQNISAVRTHYEIGFVMDGLGPRQNNALGFGITRAEASDKSSAGFTSDAEVAYELFYKVPVLPWLTIQPDVQWIHDPGASSIGDAVIASVRVALTL